MIMYRVVENITPSKIAIKNYNFTSNHGYETVVRYINKNLILNKIDYDDNPDIYSDFRKKFMFKCLNV